MGPRHPARLRHVRPRRLRQARDGSNACGMGWRNPGLGLDRRPRRTPRRERRPHRRPSQAHAHRQQPTTAIAWTTGCPHRARHSVVHRRRTANPSSSPLPEPGPRLTGGPSQQGAGASRGRERRSTESGPNRRITTSLSSDLRHGQLPPDVPEASEARLVAIVSRWFRTHQRRPSPGFLRCPGARDRLRRRALHSTTWSRCRRDVRPPGGHGQGQAGCPSRRPMASPRKKCGDLHRAGANRAPRSRGLLDTGRRDGPHLAVRRAFDYGIDGEIELVQMARSSTGSCGSSRRR